MVAIARTDLKYGNRPPLCHRVSDKHSTAGGHSAFSGALKARPPIIVDSTDDRDLLGKAGREMFRGRMVTCVATWQAPLGAETPPQESCAQGIL
jgi:hypothetical protein